MADCVALQGGEDTRINVKLLKRHNETTLPSPKNFCALSECFFRFRLLATPRMRRRRPLGWWAGEPFSSQMSGI